MTRAIGLLEKGRKRKNIKANFLKEYTIGDEAETPFLFRQLRFGVKLSLKVFNFSG